MLQLTRRIIKYTFIKSAPLGEFGLHERVTATQIESMTKLGSVLLNFIDKWLPDTSFLTSKIFRFTQHLAWFTKQLNTKYPGWGLGRINMQGQ